MKLVSSVPFFVYASGSVVVCGSAGDCFFVEEAVRENKLEKSYLRVTRFPSALFFTVEAGVRDRWMCRIVTVSKGW